MKTFNLSGVVGWDIEPSDVRRFLQEADGDEVEMIVSSPGGFVSHGLEIFNMIRNYPGHVTAVLSGYAMSMASYIPLAADTIVAEDNAVFMIHNVHGGVFGDHNYILKYGKETEALSRLLAMAYVRHTGQTLAEIEKMMDEETYFYGSEIVDAGFAKELREAASDNMDQDNCVAVARTAYRTCTETMARDTNAAAEDLTKAAAIAAADPNLTKKPKTNRAKPPIKTKKTEEQNMDLKALKSDHPDLVTALAQETVGGLDMETLAEGNQDLFNEVLEAGAAEEVSRIEDVRSQLVPGHESLIAKMEMDGTSTGADAALAIVAAEQTLRKTAGADLDDESNGTVPAADGGDDDKRQMKRAEFDALQVVDRRAFVADGGQVVA